MGQMATLVVNAVMMHWMANGSSTTHEGFHCTHPSILTKHKAGYDPSAVFQDFEFDATWLGFEPSLPAYVARTLSH